MAPTRRPRVMLIGVVGALLVAATFTSGATATFPDRTGRIAFHIDSEDGNTQLWTVRPNGKDLRQITNVVGRASNPDWSPDGRRLAFARDDCTIGLIDADGSNMEIIAADPNICQGDPAYTPDGKRLVYSRYDPVRDVAEVWSMNIDGSDQRLLTAAGDPDPNVSPDGTKVSFKGGEFGALFVQGMDGSNLTQISPSISVTYKHDWAPDGSKIVVSDESDPDPEEPVNIIELRPDGSQDVHYVTHYTGVERAFVGGYSPDGNWLVFRHEAGGIHQEDPGVQTLYRIRPDGHGLHAIIGPGDFRPRNVDWGPAPN